MRPVREPCGIVYDSAHIRHYHSACGEAKYQRRLELSHILTASSTYGQRAVHWPICTIDGVATNRSRALTQNINLSQRTVGATSTRKSNLSLTHWQVSFLLLLSLVYAR